MFFQAAVPPILKCNTAKELFSYLPLLPANSKGSLTGPVVSAEMIANGYRNYKTEITRYFKAVATMKNAIEQRSIFALNPLFSFGYQQTEQGMPLQHQGFSARRRFKATPYKGTKNNG